MKKWLLVLIVLVVGASFLVSCSTSTGGGGGTSNLTVAGLLSSYSKVFVMRNAAVNFSNAFVPVTGDAVIDATVTASNESSGTEEVSITGGTQGIYTYAGQIAAPGENLSLKVVSDSDTVTGDPTQMPNPFFTVAPNITGVSPLTISWQIDYNQTVTYEASHVWVTLNGATEGYQVIVPASTTSIVISSSEVTPGTYGLQLLGVNPMNLTGANANSMMYVGGGSGGLGTVVLIQ
jgi:hypothetical protein